MTIELKNIVKRFGAFTALDDVDLTVADGELLDRWFAEYATAVERLRSELPLTSQQAS